MIDFVHFMGYVGFVPSLFVILGYIIYQNIRRKKSSLLIIVLIYLIVPIFAALFVTYGSINLSGAERKDAWRYGKWLYEGIFKEVPERLKLLMLEPSPGENPVQLTDYVSRRVMPMDKSESNMNKVFDILVVNLIIVAVVGLFLVYEKYRDQ